jgi:RNA-directed DNA polymerase
MSGLHGRLCRDLRAARRLSVMQMILSSSSRTSGTRDVLSKRLAKYGLTLHPEKTRLIDFQRPDRRAPAPPNNNGDACSRPGTFDLLGFTHYWAMSRKGYCVVKQKTAADRFRRTLKRIADWCWQYRHEPIRDQWAALRRKLLGHYGYFGITGNFYALRNLRFRVLAVWRNWLSRRSQRARISWEEMLRLLARYPLPAPRMRSSPVT